MHSGSARWLLAATACLFSFGARAQPGAAPAECARFLGSWSGTWSQGYYGEQWIHVTGVSGDCIAQVTYNPTGPEVPAWTRPSPVRNGVIEFTCNAGTGGTCRLEIVDSKLQVRYSEASGFVNLGVFHKKP